MNFWVNRGTVTRAKVYQKMIVSLLEKKFYLRNEMNTFGKNVIEKRAHILHQPQNSKQGRILPNIKGSSLDLKTLDKRKKSETTHGVLKHFNKLKSKYNCSKRYLKY